MATSYESLIPEIIPIVPACPDSLIHQHIRSTVIDLCERSFIYQKELDPITTVASIYEYDFDAPSGTVVHKIEWAVYDGDALEPATSGLLEQRKPDWRTTTGTPEYILKQNQTSFIIAPIPASGKTEGLILRVALKPTHTSTSCDSTVMSDNRDAIVNGTLSRLLRIPAKEWSDINSASAAKEPLASSYNANAFFSLAVSEFSNFSKLICPSTSNSVFNSFNISASI